MSAFRLFGRAEPTAPPVAPGSATSHARPARRAEDLLGPRRGGAPEPPTDPFGFPPVGAFGVPPVGAFGGPPVGAYGEPPVGAFGVPPVAPEPAAVPAPHPSEAAALAAAFAVDYLSWDEDDPDRRARVLGDYLAHRRPVRLGWSGRGRQRADFALPGIVRPDGDARALVDVRVRVTPYKAVPGGKPGEPEPDEGPATPAAAPAPAARGWRGMPGQWVRLVVAVIVEGERLVIDAEEEAEDPWSTEASGDPSGEPAADLEEWS